MELFHWGRNNEGGDNDLLSAALSRYGRTIAIGVALSLAHFSASAANAPATPRLFVKRNSAVCGQKEDLLKVMRSRNTLRHFGELRSLIVAGRCAAYPQKAPVIGIGLSETSPPFAFVQIRTADRPNEARWILRRDLGEQAQ